MHVTPTDDPEQIAIDGDAGKDLELDASGLSLEAEVDATSSGDAANVEAELVTVSFGDEVDADEAALDAEAEKSPVIKQFRDAQRRDKARIRELEMQAKASAAKPEEAEALPPRPTLESSDYDEQKFADALESWHTKKSDLAAKQAKRETEAEAKRVAWSKEVESFHEALASTGVPDHKKAMQTVASALPDERQAMLVDALGPDAARLVVGLAANPQKLEQLAAQPTAGKFIAMATRLADKAKIERSKPGAPAPETVARGGVGAGAVKSSRLEQLKEQAHNTGDFNKYLEAKRAAKKVA